MTDVLTPLRKRLTRTDVLLFVAALVGLPLYVWLLPAEHPDAAASYAPGESAARQAAEAFLTARGYAVDDLEVSVQLRRNPDLLNALQAGVGRRETRRVLADVEAAAHVPAYYWQVRYTTRPDPDEDDEAAGGPLYELGVTPAGAVWQFVQNPMRRPGSAQQAFRPPRRLAQVRRADRNALQAVFARAAGGVEEPAAPVDLSALSDSLLIAVLSFNPADLSWRRRPDTLQAAFDGHAVLAALAAERDGSFTVAMGAEAAVALARYHLSQTTWESAFRADSVWLPPERDDRLAHVHFARATPLYGQQIDLDVAVSAAGALQGIHVTFNADAEKKAGTLKTVANVLEIGLYVLIILVLIVAFFKRFTARLIDGKAALLDGLAVGLLVAVMIGLSRDVNFSEPIASFWLRLLVQLLVAVVAGAATAIFALVISGTTDSLTRSVWPAKLRTSSLVRLGAFRNVYVGGALLRGVCLAFVLLGLTAGMLTLFPGAALRFQEEGAGLLDARSYQPMTWLAAVSGLDAYFRLIFILLGVGMFFYHLWRHAAPVIGAVVVTMALMQGASVQLAPVWYTWILSGLWGAVLALAFWRYDFLTSFTACSLALLFWSLGEGWLVEDSPAWMDVLLGGLLAAGVVVLGVFGVVGGKTRREVAEYVPAYISELTQQERLKRELEIARQVQMSFLPRRMPQVEGLDIAAMCLAALEVGGDYYDFVETGPGRLAVVVGDVSGKGTQAAFYMTLTKGFVQTLSRENLSPAGVMRRLNALFYENAPRGTFISMIYGVFDVAARTFTFARAGHNPVILKRSPSQEADLVQPTGLAIGLVAGPAFDESIEEVSIHLRVGDVLVFYTDGFSEAMNRVKDLYGDDRLARKVGDAGHRSASEILRAVSEDVHHFVEAAGRHDDMTMVVVKLTHGDDGVPVVVSGQQRFVAEA